MGARRAVALLVVALTSTWLGCRTGFTPVSPDGGDGDADAEIATDGAVDVDGGGDAASDGDHDASPAVDEPRDECTEESECSDGNFCNGRETCDRGVCRPGVMVDCDDGMDCTEDACHEMSNTCIHVPDHGFCDETEGCNGVERCEPVSPDADSRGCEAGHPLVCDDADPCTDDYCAHDAWHARLKDADGDGYGDWGCIICDGPGPCEAGDDCDDSDPAIHPGATEDCADGVDNDCDHATDGADPDCA